MHLSKLLYYEGCSQLSFLPKTVTGLEIWVVKDGLPVLRQKTVSPQSVKEWLDQEGLFAVPTEVQSRQVLGGVRLLIHKWRRGKEDPDSGIFTMPFDRKIFAEMMGTFLLPRSIAADFASDTHVPTRLESVRTNVGTDRLGTYYIPAFDEYSTDQYSLVGIVCQSPFLFNLFMSIALSYDPKSNMTCGFVRLMAHDQAAEALIANMIPQLKTSPEKSLHPMFLPTLAHGTWLNALRSQHERIHDRLSEVQLSTGMVRGYCMHNPLVNLHRALQPMDHSTIHATIVRQHAFLTNAMFYFVLSLGEAAEKAFKKVKTIVDVSRERVMEPVDEELRAEILLGKVQMQLQVVYNLMQQRDSQINHRIAVETQRDGSAMKSLALITMIFLPATALATIFNITSFFASSADGSQLLVTHDFWIFWSVALPLTFVTVLTWVAWINREALPSVRQKRPTRSPTNRSPKTSRAKDVEDKVPVPSTDATPAPAPNLPHSGGVNTMQQILEDHAFDNRRQSYVVPEPPGRTASQPPVRTSPPNVKISAIPIALHIAPTIPSHSSIDWGDHDESEEYKDLIKYISTYRSSLRYYSQAMSYDDEDSRRWRFFSRFR